MSTVTKCDLCGKQGEDYTENHWVKLSFSDSKLANWFDLKDRNIEVCEMCWQKLRDILIK